jgi:hypothetical protein
VVAATLYKNQLQLTHQNQIAAGRNRPGRLPAIQCAPAA